MDKGIIQVINDHNALVDALMRKTDDFRTKDLKKVFRTASILRRMAHAGDIIARMAKSQGIQVKVNRQNGRIRYSVSNAIPPDVLTCDVCTDRRYCPEFKPDSVCVTERRG